jgi:hypothetical protein
MGTHRESATSARRAGSQQRSAPLPPALPAKLLRPAASGLIPRERLFARLDRAPQARIVWISGPGGAGKTSFVSTYVEARGLDCLWYQVDASDADSRAHAPPAARGRGFLPRCCRRSRRRTPARPVRTPFREAFFVASGARHGWTTTRSRPDARFHDLASLLDHLPECAGRVSRTEPPPRWRSGA